MFEPASPGAGPSGLADWPRPFVFRARHLDGRSFSSGEHFHFDLNLFRTEDPPFAYLLSAFAQLSSEGLGPSRRKAELTSVARLDENGAVSGLLYETPSMKLEQHVTPLSFDLRATPHRVPLLRVRFLTPTELKSGECLAPRPEFGVLASRVRDRISTLRELYGSGPLDIDFRGFGERAAKVQMVRCELQVVKLERRSSRTGQSHSIGGFVGEAEYEGELEEFAPYMRVAQWSGVGRQTVWGKGAIEVLYCNGRDRQD